MRSLWILPVLAAVAAQPLSGQEPPMQRQQLQQQIVQRFMQNYRDQAGLSDEQFQRFQETARSSFEARSQLLRRERELWMALHDQMRPGVAADEDSLTTLMNDLIAVQEERLEQARAELQEWGSFLTPVQQAQLLLSWRRLQMQIERVRAGRQQRGPPGMP